MPPPFIPPTPAPFPSHFSLLVPHSSPCPRHPGVRSRDPAPRSIPAHQCHPHSSHRPQLPSPLTHSSSLTPRPAPVIPASAAGIQHPDRSQRTNATPIHPTDPSSLPLSLLTPRPSLLALPPSSRRPQPGSSTPIDPSAPMPPPFIPPTPAPFPSHFSLLVPHSSPCPRHPGVRSRDPAPRSIPAHQCHPHSSHRPQLPSPLTSHSSSLTPRPAPVIPASPAGIQQQPPLPAATCRYLPPLPSRPTPHRPIRPRQSPGFPVQPPSAGACDPCIASRVKVDNTSVQCSYHRR